MKAELQQFGETIEKVVNKIKEGDLVERAKELEEFKSGCGRVLCPEKNCKHSHEFKRDQLIQTIAGRREDDQSKKPQIMPQTFGL